MNEKLVSYFHHFAALSDILPMIPALVIFRKTDFKIKWFIVYLSMAFLTDFVSGYFYTSGNIRVLPYISRIYSLIEPLFLFWLIGKISTNLIIKWFFTRSWIIIVVVWGVCMAMVSTTNWLYIYRTVVAVLISFASAYRILQLVEEENENAFKSLLFWIMSGIFFYFFSVFFIWALTTTVIGIHLWWFHNVISIITNLIYTYGFIQARKVLSS